MSADDGYVLWVSVEAVVMGSVSSILSIESRMTG
jgi:hypothetical protein